MLMQPVGPHPYTDVTNTHIHATLMLCGVARTTILIATYMRIINVEMRVQSVCLNFADQVCCIHQEEDQSQDRPLRDTEKGGIWKRWCWPQRTNCDRPLRYEVNHLCTASLTPYDTSRRCRSVLRSAVWKATGRSSNISVAGSSLFTASRISAVPSEPLSLSIGELCCSRHSEAWAAVSKNWDSYLAAERRNSFDNTDR